MQGLVKRELVHMIEPAAGGHALGEAGDGDAFGAEEVAQVAGGGLAFDIAAHGEDDLLHGGGAQTVEQGLDAQVLGGDVVERGELAPEHMVEAGEGAGALKAEDIGGLLDDADEACVPLRAVAEGAVLALFDVETALGAGVDAVVEVFQRVHKRLDAAAALQEPEHEALGAAGPEAGEGLDLRDHALQGRRVVEGGHERGRGWKEPRFRGMASQGVH